MLFASIVLALMGGMYAKTLPSFIENADSLKDTDMCIAIVKSGASPTKIGIQSATKIRGASAYLFPCVPKHESGGNQDQKPDENDKDENSGNPDLKQSSDTANGTAAYLTSIMTNNDVLTVLKDEALSLAYTY